MQYGLYMVLWASRLNASVYRLNQNEMNIHGKKSSSVKSVVGASVSLAKSINCVV